MAKRKNASAKADGENELKILFPFVDVELHDGSKVVVMQWNIDTGAILSARVIAMMQKQSGLTGTIELSELIARAKGECFDIVATTIGWTVEELRTKATFEDFMDLLQAVIDTSLVREGGGGALPKLIGLAGALGPLAALGQPKARLSPVPSTSLSGKDTPSPNSGE